MTKTFDSDDRRRPLPACRRRLRTARHRHRGKGPPEPAATGGQATAPGPRFDRSARARCHPEHSPPGPRQDGPTPARVQLGRETYQRLESRS